MLMWFSHCNADQVIREHIKIPLSNNFGQVGVESKSMQLSAPESETWKAKRYQLLWLTRKQWHSAKYTHFPDFSLFCKSLSVLTGNKV